jgi:hypothetical protein
MIRPKMSRKATIPYLPTPSDGTGEDGAGDVVCGHATSTIASSMNMAVRPARMTLCTGFIVVTSYAGGLHRMCHRLVVSADKSQFSLLARGPARDPERGQGGKFFEDIEITR